MIIETYIDIIFAISIVSYYIKNLLLDYFSTMDHILRYLAGSPNKKKYLTIN